MTYTLTDDKIAYNSLLGNETTSKRNILGVYACWEKSIPQKKIRPVIKTMFERIKNVNELDNLESPTNSPIILIALNENGKLRKRRSRYIFRPVTKDYITFEYRQDLREVMLKLFKIVTNNESI